MTNPYAPPQFRLAGSDQDGLLSVPVVATFIMDSKYVIDATDRTRRRHAIRTLWMIARWPCAALLLLTAAVLAFNAPIFWSIGLAAFTIGSFHAYRVDDLYNIWLLKRSGWLDAACRITMSDSGYRLESRGFDMTVPWSSFRCADIFDDGVNFFQTWSSSLWIPWEAIASTNERDRLLAFVQTTFAANHRFHGSGGGQRIL